MHILIQICLEIALQMSPQTKIYFCGFQIMCYYITGSHSLCLLATFIKGQTPFPEFSYVAMLDDVGIMYYNGETKTLHPRDTTAEDGVFDSNVLLTISDYIHTSFMDRWVVATKNVNETDRKYCNFVSMMYVIICCYFCDCKISKSNLNLCLYIKGVVALQRLVVCELRDDGELGQMITRDAFRGSTTDELLYVDKKFTYQGTLNVSAHVKNVILEFSMRHHEVLYQPFCIKTLKGYLKKRKKSSQQKRYND